MTSRRWITVRDREKLGVLSVAARKHPRLEPTVDPFDADTNGYDDSSIANSISCAEADRSSRWISVMGD